MNDFSFPVSTGSQKLNLDKIDHSILKMYIVSDSPLHATFL